MRLANMRYLCKETSCQRKLLVLQLKGEAFMKAKMIFASVLLALSAGAASADDQAWDAGVISTDPLHPSSHIFLHDSGGFIDTIDFVIPNPALGTSASPLYLNLGGTLVTNITSLAYSVYDGTSLLPGSLVGSYWGNNTTYNVPVTLAGAYHIIVTGSVAGTDTQGAYALALVSAVPEPQTYAMMLLGIGMIGYAARRRQRRG